MLATLTLQVLSLARATSSIGDRNTLVNNRAVRLVASTFGVLAGLGGLWHGIGEVLQGNVTPDGIAIDSWTEGPIASNMGGEPGITIIPNLLITGILAIVFSSAVIVWAAAFVHRKNGGLLLILLSVGMLLFGGGVGPPIIGMLAGAAGVGINAPLVWWRKHIPANGRRLLAQLWPWVFGVCAAAAVLLVIGSLILVYTLDLDNPDFFVFNFFFVLLFLPVTIVAGAAFDIRNREQGVAV